MPVIKLDFIKTFESLANYPTHQINFNEWAIPDNFAQIAEVMNSDFSHLFNLKYLNEAAKLLQSDANAPIGYLNLYSQCVQFISQEQDRFSQENIKSAIKLFFETQATKNYLGQNIIVIPTKKLLIPEAAPIQIGLLEKIATGLAQAQEPLTFIDMIRLLEELCRNQIVNGLLSYEITSLNQLCFSPYFLERTWPDVRRFLPENKKFTEHKLLLVNFNENQSEPANWVLIDHHFEYQDLRSHIIVYSESELTKPHRQKLEAIYQSDKIFNCSNQTLPDLTYDLGNKAFNPISTGYAVLAYLNTKISNNVSNFKPENEFILLQQKVLDIYFGLTLRGCSFTHCSHDPRQKSAHEFMSIYSPQDMIVYWYNGSNFEYSYLDSKREKLIPWDSYLKEEISPYGNINENVQNLLTQISQQLEINKFLWIDRRETIGFFSTLFSEEELKQGAAYPNNPAGNFFNIFTNDCILFTTNFKEKTQDYHEEVSINPQITMIRLMPGRIIANAFIASLDNPNTATHICKILEQPIHEIEKKARDYKPFGFAEIANKANLSSSPTNELELEELIANQIINEPDTLAHINQYNIKRTLTKKSTYDYTDTGIWGRVKEDISYKGTELIELTQALGYTYNRLLHVFNLKIPDAYQSIIYQETLSSQASKHRPTASILDQWNMRHSSNTRRLTPSDVAEHIRDHHVLITMILIAFLRCNARNRHVSLNLPASYEISKDGHIENFIVSMINNNAEITGLTIKTPNASLNRIKKRLEPIFARNQWLEGNGYKPPLFDYFWNKACKYYIRFLNEFGHTLFTNTECPPQYHLLQNTMSGMGSEGLKQILSFLKNDGSNYIENLHQTIEQREQLPFYLALYDREENLADWQASFNTLSEYLTEKNYFPFQRIALALPSQQAFHADTNTRSVSFSIFSAELAKFITGLNKKEPALDKIILTNTESITASLHKLLINLNQIAQQDEWTTLLDIPALNDISKPKSKQDSLLRECYTLLNNLILNNQRRKIALTKIEQLNQVRDQIVNQSIENLESLRLNQPLHANEQLLNEVIHQQLFIDQNIQWPFISGVGQQLQIQQQQQQQQCRQTQQEQQVDAREVNEPLTETLISYENIDELFSAYFNEYKANPNHRIIETAASLGDSDVSILKRFYHTWVNKNPLVKEPHLIGTITLDAAKILLKNHALFSSGLNLNNLPAGFYTTIYNGLVVLRFNIEEGYIKPPTPLTLKLNTSSSDHTPERWLGDFRQFDIEYFLQKIDQIQTDDIHHANTSILTDKQAWAFLQLFTVLQPVQTTFNEALLLEIQDTMTNHEMHNDENRAMIERHWAVFFEAWQYSPCEATMIEFLKYFKTEVKISLEELLSLFMANHPESIKLIQTFVYNEESFRAFGQIYYQYGREGIQSFLEQIQLIQDKLGDGFFTVFKEHVLHRADDYCQFMTKRFTFHITHMVCQLAVNDVMKAMWQQILTLHMQASQGDDVTQLWEGFAFFWEKLEDDRVKLSGKEFNTLKPGNMLIIMERILHCMSTFIDANRKTNFMQALSSEANPIDLTAGGVPYAIQIEGFQHIGSELQLQNFHDGTPTYTPNLVDYYTIEPGSSTEQLYLTRLLAIQTMPESVYYQLYEQISLPLFKHKLLWILLGDRGDRNIQETLALLGTVDPQKLELLAHMLHAAYLTQTTRNFHIDLQALLFLADKLELDQLQTFFKYLKKVDLPAGVALEVLGTAIMFHCAIHPQNPITTEDIQQILKQISLAIQFPECPLEVYSAMLKITAVYGFPSYSPNIAISNEADATHSPNEEGTIALLENIQMMFLALQNTPLMKREIIALGNQLISIDFYKTDAKNLREFRDARIQQNFYTIPTIEAVLRDMCSFPGQSAQIRKNFLTELKHNGIIFTCIISDLDNLRILNDNDKPVDLSPLSFSEHSTRLWQFMKNHLLIAKNTNELNKDHSLTQLVLFFRQMENNKTYLNEIEPILTLLETLNLQSNLHSEETEVPKPAAHISLYWSAKFFNQLLRALLPDSKNQNASFPISLLKELLTDSPTGIFVAKSLEQADSEFPSDMTRMLQRIVNTDEFTPSQRIGLCRLLKTLSLEVVTKIKETLLTHHALTRDAILNLFLQNNLVIHERINPLVAQTDQLIEKCDWFYQIGRSFNPKRIEESRIQDVWPETISLWLNAINHENQLWTCLNVGSDYFDPEIPRLSPQEIGVFLHIIAWSGFAKNPYSSDNQNTKKFEKINRLITALKMSGTSNRVSISLYYPQKPSPDIETLTTICEKVNTLNLSESKAEYEIRLRLATWEASPYAKISADRTAIVSMRQIDFERILDDMVLIRGEVQKHLTIEDKIRLTKILSNLKAYESNQLPISWDSSRKNINVMRGEDIREAFNDLSKYAEDNDTTRGLLLAILFETLRRTKGQYPHLAQQIAIISTDLFTEKATTPILAKLSTGEGKSNFLACRAARYAGQGKKVTICTAKRSLVHREFIEYKDFYAYLGIAIATIAPNTPREKFTQSKVRITTLGDLSLFVDQQKLVDGDFKLDKEYEYALFDEFDFIRFNEGIKTQYNYARPIGKMPKEMIWFYRAINHFYNSNFFHLTPHPANFIRQDISKFKSYLLDQAGNDEEKTQFLQTLLTNDDVHLAQWIQAAYQAHHLKEGQSFVTREETITYGNESYQMLEIIPLSSDNQKMFGASFSGGVQQLLAVHLNEQAIQANLRPNYHVQQESRIISSQVAPTCIENFFGYAEAVTGSLSFAQAKQIFDEMKMQVLEIPTNKESLRQWHPLKFYNDNNQRLIEAVNQIISCLDKQQSILIACKDDLKVIELETCLFQQLEQVNRMDLKNQFIFYTNKQTETSAEILTLKHKNENWSQGIKQNGIVLVASGFGRGDNVEVENVILFDVNDMSDQIQKAGRTARNGAEGQVFQYYLNTELNEELKQLLNSLALSFPIQEVHAIQTKLQQIKSNDYDEKVFIKVMCLREFLQNYNSHIDQCYRRSVAEYSAWCCDNIGKINANDPHLRHELLLKLTSQMMHIEETWTKLTALEDKTQEEKLKEIKTSIQRLSEEFRTKNSITFEFKQESNKPELLIREKTTASAKDKLITRICNRILLLSQSEEEVDPFWPDTIVESLSSLSEMAPDVLKMICDNLPQYQSKQAIFNIFCAFEMLFSPAHEANNLFKILPIKIQFQYMVNATTVILEYFSLVETNTDRSDAATTALVNLKARITKILQNQPANFNTQKTQINKLIEDASAFLSSRTDRSRAIDDLWSQDNFRQVRDKLDMNNLSMERINKVSQFLIFINHVHPNQQNDYLDHFDAIMDLTPELLPKFLQTNILLRYTHAKKLWELACNVCREETNSNIDAQALDHLYPLLLDAINKNHSDITNKLDSLMEFETGLLQFTKTHPKDQLDRQAQLQFIKNIAMIMSKGSLLPADWLILRQITTEQLLHNAPIVMSLWNILGQLCATPDFNNTNHFKIFYDILLQNWLLQGEYNDLATKQSIFTLLIEIATLVLTTKHESVGLFLGQIQQYVKNFWDASFKNACLNHSEKMAFMRALILFIRADYEVKIEWHKQTNKFKTEQNNSNEKVLFNILQLGDTLFLETIFQSIQHEISLNQNYFTLMMLLIDKLSIPKQDKSNEESIRQTLYKNIGNLIKTFGKEQFSNQTLINIIQALKKLEEIDINAFSKLAENKEWLQDIQSISEISNELLDLLPKMQQYSSKMVQYTLMKKILVHRNQLFTESSTSIPIPHALREFFLKQLTLESLINIEDTTLNWLDLLLQQYTSMTDEALLKANLELLKINLELIFTNNYRRNFITKAQLLEKTFAELSTTADKMQFIHYIQNSDIRKQIEAMLESNSSRGTALIQAMHPWLVANKSKLSSAAKLFETVITCTQALEPVAIRKLFLNPYFPILNDVLFEAVMQPQAQYRSLEQNLILSDYFTIYNNMLSVIACKIESIDGQSIATSLKAITVHLSKLQSHSNCAVFKNYFNFISAIPKIDNKLTTAYFSFIATHIDQPNVITVFNEFFTHLPKPIDHTLVAQYMPFFPMKSVVLQTIFLMNCSKILQNDEVSLINKKSSYLSSLFNVINQHGDKIQKTPEILESWLQLIKKNSISSFALMESILVNFTPVRSASFMPFSHFLADLSPYQIQWIKENALFNACENILGIIPTKNIGQLINTPDFGFDKIFFLQMLECCKERNEHDREQQINKILGLHTNIRSNPSINNPELAKAITNLMQDLSIANIIKNASLNQILQNTLPKLVTPEKVILLHKIISAYANYPSPMLSQMLEMFTRYPDNCQLLITDIVSILENKFQRSRENKIVQEYIFKRLTSILNNLLTCEVPNKEKQLEQFKNYINSHEQHIKKIFADDSVLYITKMPDAKILTAQGVISDLYARMDTTDHGEIDNVFSHFEAVDKLFDFESTDRAKIRRRIILLNLLYSKKCISDRWTPAGQRRWTELENNQLLTLALNKYQEKTQSILMSIGKKTKHKPQLGELSKNQELQLLSLCNELKEIATMIHLVPPVQGVNSDLTGKLNRALTSYSGKLFATKIPATQLHTFSQKILTIGQQGLNSYDEIWSMLSAQKLLAVDQYIKDNNSRFFDTLTQMQNIVAETWSQDRSALISFKDYDTLLSKEFTLLLQKIKTIIQQLPAGKKTSVLVEYCDDFPKSDKPINQAVIDSIKRNINAHLENLVAIKRTSGPEYVSILAHHALMRGEVIEESLRKSETPYMSYN